MGRDVCSDEQLLHETDLEFHYRSGPQRPLAAHSGGRTLGLLRPGPLLTPANLRHRPRSMKRLDDQERPRLSLMLAAIRGAE